MSKKAKKSKSTKYRREWERLYLGHESEPVSQEELRARWEAEFRGQESDEEAPPSEHGYFPVKIGDELIGFFRIQVGGHTPAMIRSMANVTARAMSAAYDEDIHSPETPEPTGYTLAEFETLTEICELVDFGSNEDYFSGRAVTEGEGWKTGFHVKP